MATQRARGAALLRVALVLSFLAASDARSSGPASCDARSGHGASDSGGGGYTLAVSNASVDVTAVAPNTRLELLLTAPDGSAFKGFVMHAANAGAFAVADALVSERVESCHAGNAVGHRSASSKTRVRAYFTAPATGGAVTITAQAVESRMVVYETALELTVVEDGDADDAEDEAEDDAEDEAEDDAEDEAEDDARVDDRDASNASNASLASNASYALNASLASDVTLRWTVGPANATADAPAIGPNRVAFAIETTRADARSIAVAFQPREGDGAMFPADAVVAWLAFDDDVPGSPPDGFVGSYALVSYDAATGVVGPTNPNLAITAGSVERRAETATLTARFVATRDEVARATGVADAFSEPAAAASVRVAYAVGSRAGKAYHDLGRGASLVHLANGGSAARSVARSATLKRKRFLAHGVLALAAWACFGVGTAFAAFRESFSTSDARHAPRTTRTTTTRAVTSRRAAPLATSASSGAGTAARGSGVWFVAHVVAQTGGGALAIAALAVALRESTGETGVAFDWDRADANVALMAHGAFGVALVACVVAQASLGARREKMSRPAEDDDDGAPPPTATKRAPAPLRGAHVALGWLLAFGGFANAAVGAGLFERLDARDREAAGASGDASSVFSAVAWTGFAVVAVSFCLRLRRTSRRDAACASGASRAG